MDYDFTDTSKMYTDAGMTTPVANDGGIVVAVVDKGTSTHGRGNLGGTGTFRAAGINGKPAIEFDGVAQRFLIDINAGVPSSLYAGSDIPSTTHWVQKHTTNPAATKYAWGAGHSSNVSAHYRVSVGTTGSYTLRKRHDAGSTGVTASLLTTPAIGSVDVLSIRNNGTTVDVWRNGVQILTAAPLDQGTTTTNRMAIGAHYDSSTREACPIMFGRFAAYIGAQSDADIAAVQATLMDQFDVV
jgi:hypothetical protein